MATNPAASFVADIEGYLADETLPLARRQLVAYQFGDPLTLPKGRGTAYTATRYNRVPLPFAPLSEGVPPIGQAMTISQVSATAQQWGDKITITDVGELTIKHPLFVKAKELLGLQIAETFERNTFNALLAGPQINYVNTRGARGSLLAGDVLNPHEVTRATAILETLGAPRFDGDEMTDTRLEADAGGARASSNPRKMPHYAAICHTLVVADMRENPTINQAWTFSDINRLYNYELGEWAGIRFTRSNLVPTFTGVTALTATAGAGGSLAAGTYSVQVTASDTQNQYESRIYGVQTGLVVGANGSINVPLPALVGFTFNVYVNGSNSSPPFNLGVSPAGPTVGPLAGQATQLAPNQTVVITGVGIPQVPPAAPANGITVFPTFIFGRGGYGQVKLDDVRFTYLKDADKSDPLNQLRVVGWKAFYGTLLENVQFFMRIESTSAFSVTFG
ncbi:MAG TPA: N4-gp56 family major capsid protein [Candidatus Acidoferrum sp.]